MRAVTLRLPAGNGAAVALGRIRRYLEGLPSNVAFDVTVAEHKPRRSLAQNAYLWGVVYPAILEHEQLRGWSPDDLHEYCLGEWSGWEKIECQAFGRARLRPRMRSSTLNKQQFTDFIEDIKARMAALGIQIPEANEHG